MKLIDAPVGLLKCGNTLLMKTEYFETCASGSYPACYIVESGEVFWGGAKTSQGICKTEVEPVEVVPVVHGHWVRSDFFSDIQTVEECSLCGELISRFSKRLNYCPNCGAKMDEEADT